MQAFGKKRTGFLEKPVAKKEGEKMKLKGTPVAKRTRMPNKLLVCGTRGTFLKYKEMVEEELDKIKEDVSEIIEGCCPASADQYAEEWTVKNNFPIRHYPANSGNYLKRNVEMVKTCHVVIAFWDGFSYGTAHTIATAVALGKIVNIIPLARFACAKVHKLEAISDFDLRIEEHKKSWAIAYEK
jgi:hypothetical protein